MPPPNPAAGQPLTFVCVALKTFPAGSRAVSPAVALRLEEVLAMQAQQFKGYMYQLRRSEVLCPALPFL
jgi:hypothetical protein